jgi:hypothetical protein
MVRSNRVNLLFILVFALTVSVGCNLLQSPPPEKTSKTKSDGGESTSGNSETDDEINLSLDDDDESATDSDSKPEVKKTSGQTVVKFGKGKTSRGYQNAVIRGEKQTYLLGASKGQTMSVNITSLEDNASFYILSPSQTYVGDGLEEDGIKRFNGTLPESGNYKIIVSPTRGNATFKINFAVSAKETAPPPSQSGGITKVVKFRKGGTSASYSNSVIRGDRDTYILGASGGQIMSVSISSTENNAVFDIVSPSGNFMTTEKRSWSGQLPQNGKYQIIVGGTRGNATYKVSFSVR